MALVSFIAVVAGCGLSIADVASDAGPLMSDIRTGVLVTLGIAFVLLACAVGVTQAASVLEERELIVVSTARHPGCRTPPRPPHHRDGAAAMGLGGRAALGLMLAFPIVGISLIVAPLSVLTIALTFAAGFALVAAALASTRPIVTGIRRGAL